MANLIRDRCFLTYGRTVVNPGQTIKVPGGARLGCNFGMHSDLTMTYGVQLWDWTNRRGLLWKQRTVAVGDNWIESLGNFTVDRDMDVEIVLYRYWEGTRRWEQIDSSGRFHVRVKEERPPEERPPEERPPERPPEERPPEVGPPPEVEVPPEITPPARKYIISFNLRRKPWIRYAVVFVADKDGKVIRSGKLTSIGETKTFELPVNTYYAGAFKAPYIFKPPCLRYVKITKTGSSVLVCGGYEIEISVGKSR